MVSWFGRNDLVFFEEGMGGRRDQYEHVVATINPEQMERDGAYLEAVIKGLLEQKRVRRYIETGLNTEQEIAEETERVGASGSWPCGRYVGEIKKQEGKYIKAFDPNVGRAEHNSPQMQAEREEYKRKQAEEKARRIADKQAQIARLQAEIEEEQK